MSRRSRRWLILIGILCILVLGLRLGRNRICERALREVAAQADGNGYMIDFNSVQVSVFSGNISITGLSLRPVAAIDGKDSSAWYSASADEVELSGVEIWALIKEKRLQVRHVFVRAPSIEHSYIPRKHKSAKAPRDRTPAGKKPGLGLVRIDTLRIDGANGGMIDRSKNAPSMQVGRLDLLVCGINVTLGDGSKPQVSLDAAELSMHHMETELAPFYTFRIDSMKVQVPRDSSVIFGVHMIPSVDPNDYHKQVKFQTELYGLDIDTVLLGGFDLAAKLDEGILRAERLYVSGAAFSIHRDKSIPLPPERKRKPLLAERIVDLPMPLSLDTVELKRSSVTYHERLKRGEAYGSIAFTAINGRLTGIDNIDVEADAGVHLLGEASVGSSTATLDLRMPVLTGRTRLSAHVRLRDLPAREINRMTDELVHVNATAGRIHSVEMRMEGDDISAKGTVDIRYQDLHLEISETIKHAGVFSFLANTVVRTSNMPGDKKFKVGRFNVERRQEASVFNYIWLCLREGMLDVMLPPVLLDRIHKMQDEKKKGG